MRRKCHLTPEVMKLALERFLPDLPEPKAEGFELARPYPARSRADGMLVRIEILGDGQLTVTTSALMGAVHEGRGGYHTASTTTLEGVFAISGDETSHHLLIHAHQWELVCSQLEITPEGAVQPHFAVPMAQ